MTYDRNRYRKDVEQRVRDAILFGIALLVCAVIVGVHSTPSSYPRSYAVSDTWRATARDDGSTKVDASGGRCFIFNSDKSSDCLNQGMIPTVNASLEEAVAQGKEGKIWEGPNGNGEHWVIERKGRQLKITATGE